MIRRFFSAFLEMKISSMGKKIRKNTHGKKWFWILGCILMIILWGASIYLHIQKRYEEERFAKCVQKKHTMIQEYDHFYYIYRLFPKAPPIEGALHSIEKSLKAWALSCGLKNCNFFLQPLSHTSSSEYCASLEIMGTCIAETDEWLWAFFQMVLEEFPGYFLFEEIDIEKDEGGPGSAFLRCRFSGKGVAIFGENFSTEEHGQKKSSTQAGKKNSNKMNNKISSSKRVLCFSETFV